MDKGVIIGLVLVLVAGIGVVAAVMYSSTSQNQQQLEDVGQSSNIQVCEETKRNVCMAAGSVSESSYSDSCFVNGEHVLENPYECSN